MIDYEARFRKDMGELLKAHMEFDKLNDQYKEIVLFLNQFASIPDHLKYLLIG